MTRAFRGRLSPRDQKIAVNKALDHWAAMSGRSTPEGLRNEIPEKRARIKRPAEADAPPLEKEVLADILHALRMDPRVAIVDRRQSGLFQDGDRYIKVGTKGVLDISGMLCGGQYFEIEAKREGQFPDDRQWQRIYAVRNGGGIAGCAHNVEEALALLP